MPDPTRILMCPPVHFEVGYAINPWMKGNIDQLDHALAAQQWQTLVAALSEVAVVIAMPPQPGLPDMVFTANAGVVYRQQAMGSHFMPEERRGEEPFYDDWFREHGFALYELPENIAFEGAGDCLLDRRGPWVWAAYGIRTETSAHEHLRQFFGDREVVSLRLIDPRFYHVDTCLCPLSDGYLLYYPNAFGPGSLDAIESRVPKDRRIPVEDADAENFACNAVNVGDQVFLTAASNELKKRLASKGFNTRELDLGEFLKSGGSAKCLTLRLTEPDP